MREHRMTPEQLAMYRERKTAGCYNCIHQITDKLRWKVICRIEDSFNKKLGYPNATRDDCKHYQPKGNK